MGKITEVRIPDKSVSEYENYSDGVYRELNSVSKDLKGLSIAHINATAIGGGVAEMLPSQVALERNLGLKSSWYVIPPDEDYFAVTKSLHNMLQGKEGLLLNKQKDIYLNHNHLIAQLLDRVNADILIIHDPQPLASLSFMKKKPKLAVWRCHIDTTSPNLSAWDFLLPYIKEFDKYIFTMKDFVHKSLDQSKVYLIPPSIDPFTEKNKKLEKAEALYIIENLGIDIKNPLLTQVSRLDPWKDPKGVIDAFRIAKKSIPNLQLAFVAQSADDDPEGKIVEEEVRKYAGNIKNIHFIINAEDNDRVVNAFQTVSDVIIQKSIREGFALTVTEAMWKGAVVIGGNTGGIRLQIKDGENGYLVNNVDEAAEKVEYVINNPEKSALISKAAHESVQNNFLMTNLLLKHFKVYERALY